MNKRLKLLSIVVAAIAGLVLMLVLFTATIVLIPISGDGFADNLEIPKDIEISAVAAWPPARITEEDPFQQTILAIPLPDSPPPRNPYEFATPRPLTANEAPQTLVDYMAANPAWRVSGHKTQLIGRRRWTVDGSYRITLHGYYSDPDQEKPRSVSNSRVTAYLDAQPHDLNHISSAKVFLTAGLKLVIDGPEPTQRPAFEFIDAELSAIRENGFSPAEFARYSAASDPSPALEIFASFEPGIYESVVWLNPGEPGQVFLKAYEITQGTRLSASTLFKRTHEWIGWSNNPNERFFANAHFTIYEGDWGQPYAARFEVWFRPSKGGPDRKLAERNYIIEGWMR